MNAIGSFDNFYFDETEPGVTDKSDSESASGGESITEEPEPTSTKIKGPPVKKTLLNSETYIPMARAEKLKPSENKQNISNAESEVPPTEKTKRKRKATTQENPTQSPGPEPKVNPKKRQSPKKATIQKTEVTPKLRTPDRRKENRKTVQKRRDLQLESEDLKNQIGNIFNHLGRVYFSLN